MIGFALHDAADRDEAVEAAAPGGDKAQRLGQLVGARDLNGFMRGADLFQHSPGTANHAVRHVAVIGCRDDEDLGRRTFEAWYIAENEIGGAHTPLPAVQSSRGNCSSGRW